MTQNTQSEAVQEFVQLCAESFKRDGAIRLSEPEVTILLLGTAVCFANRKVGTPTTGIDEIGWYCWWDISNALSRAARVAIHGTMREMGVPFPPHPGDIIEAR